MLDKFVTATVTEILVLTSGGLVTGWISFLAGWCNKNRSAMTVYRSPGSKLPWSTSPIVSAGRSPPDWFRFGVD
ncbi:hypothetical protein RRG08_011850 [Elysia crispata]|uniref:Uncharacterized protein n=1 Tax=Elysia crispata TaxID=231223 RepID=A0AAE0ZMK9_9GAST|nr:hypothetical protein RRG08_011850 [Elysia crispata]